MPVKKTNTYIKFGYAILAILFIIIFCSCINFKSNKIEYTSIRNKTNINSNIEGYSNIKETKTNNDIANIIENKLKSLNEELGGKNGKKEAINILKNSKEVINLECAKCMMDIIQHSKGAKSINIEDLLDDNNDENCNKCKKYTELSKTISNIIDNI
tara:strand:+ start:7630 stop:8100 length:471 start_codon:yes stop_codon:yes gene_type:complete